MKPTPFIAVLAAVSALGFLAACAGGGGGQNIGDYRTACMFEVDPAGSYVWSDGDSEVKAGGGGTAEGAAAMNACIRRKAAEAGDPLVGGMSSERVEVVQTGDTVVETYTYGTPPTAAKTPIVTTDIDGESCRRRNVLSGGYGHLGCAQ